MHAGTGSHALEAHSRPFPTSLMPRHAQECIQTVEMHCLCYQGSTTHRRPGSRRAPWFGLRWTMQDQSPKAGSRSQLQTVKEEQVGCEKAAQERHRCCTSMIAPYHDWVLTPASMRLQGWASSASASPQAAIECGPHSVQLPSRHWWSCSGRKAIATTGANQSLSQTAPPPTLAGRDERQKARSEGDGTHPAGDRAGGAEFLSLLTMQSRLMPIEGLSCS